MSYAQARKDFEALEEIAELSDQMSLDEQRLQLMQNPTKAFAELLYVSAIELWFRQHGVEMIASENKSAAEIKERYCL